MKKLILLILAAVMLLGSFTACENDTPAETTVPTTTTGLINDTEPTDTSEDLGGDETDPTGTTTEDTVPEGYVPEAGFETPENITIKIENDKLNYRVVRPENSHGGSPEVKRAAFIVSSFSDMVGKAPEFDTDWPRKNNSDTLEILVGLTDYDETAAVLDEIKYGEYIVKAVGNKIIIMGYLHLKYFLSLNLLKCLRSIVENV